VAKKMKLESQTRNNQSYGWQIPRNTIGNREDTTRPRSGPDQPALPPSNRQPALSLPSLLSILSSTACPWPAVPYSTARGDWLCVPSLALTAGVGGGNILAGPGRGGG
jgi:hypothetical protein